MKTDYITTTRGDYATIHYYVTVHCEDDSVHFPVYNFSGWFILKGVDVSKTEDEIYEMALDHLKANIKDRYGYTFEELEADPAFKDIYVSVEKELYFDRKIKLTK